MKKINNWEIFKNDLIRFSKENDLNNCIAIGHSMGAVLILLAEIQIPGLFKKIFYGCYKLVLEKEMVKLL